MSDSFDVAVIRDDLETVTEPTIIGVIVRYGGEGGGIDAALDLVKSTFLASTEAETLRVIVAPAGEILPD